MNNQSTIEKMRHMRLTAMAETYHNSQQGNLCQDYTTDQFISLLVDQEWEYRYNQRIKNLVSSAEFRYPASVKDIDYTANRSLDRNLFERLALLDFTKKNENVIITGATGTGKSYLAQALGHNACMMQIKTLYFNTARLMDLVRLSKLEGTYLKFVKKIEKTELLILDDFGLKPFDELSRNALMDIVEMKYDKSSMIIASQFPVKCWHELIGEGTIADAILDRIIHSSHRIELIGESMRKNRNKISQEIL